MLMDSGREAGFSSENVVQIVPGNSGGGGVDNWIPGSRDQVVWENDYRVWNGDAFPDATMNSNYDGRRSQSRSGSEPPNKKSRNSQVADSPGSGLLSSNRSKAIGKMFFKTKLCCKFRAGTCPYVTNCNFAHSIEELRRPPPNWQEIVAAHEAEGGAPSEPREEFQIPSLESPGFGVEIMRSYKGRHCKKFYTEEGCPYGDSCSFLHDEQSKARESVAISLGPGAGGGYASVVSGSTIKPSNWKTRICNKWELTGYCPFGNKCHFAHGAAELHQYGGGPSEMEARDYLSTPDSKQGGVPSKALADTVVTSVSSIPHSDVYHIGVPQRSSSIIQRPGHRILQKWKGPNKISRIYGDWIDDIE